MSENNQTPNGDIQRRQFPRRSFFRPVALLAKGKFSITKGQEISENGIGLETTRKLDVGQKVVLTFDVPGQQTIVVTGEVRSIIPKGGPLVSFGISFLNIDVSSKRKTRTYIAARSQKEAVTEQPGQPT